MLFREMGAHRHPRITLLTHAAFIEVIGDSDVGINVVSDDDSERMDGRWDVACGRKRL